MDALEFVRERLATEGLNLREVADGAGVGHSWLRMFARGEIPDPGYSRIKALSDYFLRVGTSRPPIESPPQQVAGYTGHERRRQMQ